jgi:hypothetical protein
MSPDHYDWSPLSLSEVNDLFYNLPVPWWIAGGLAIELFVGFPVRSHEDIDIAVFREDQLIIQEYLADWDLHVASASRLTPWKQGKFLELGVNQVWARRTPGSPWALEIMFMERDNSEWFFRRAPQVRGPLSELIRYTREGIPYLSPEIQLLFKAKEIVAAKDELDFQAVLPQLDASQRHRLLSRLEVVFPQGHIWIDALK